MTTETRTNGMPRRSHTYAHAKRGRLTTHDATTHETSGMGTSHATAETKQTDHPRYEREKEKEKEKVKEKRKKEKKNSKTTMEMRQLSKVSKESKIGTTKQKKQRSKESR